MSTEDCLFPKAFKLDNKCSECKRLFRNYSVLRRHVKRFHTDKVNELCPLKRSLKTYPFSCHCGKNFTYRFNYTRHLKTHENDQDFRDQIQLEYLNKPKKCKKCPLCPYVSDKKIEMHTHFKEHDIEINIQELQFPNIEEYQVWHTSIEEQSKTKFVKERGAISKKSNVTINYICYRSGFFKSEGKGMRNLKSQGSNKINGFCPAGIKVVMEESGACVVKYVEQHVGHDMDVLRLRLTNPERQAIADKLASKISFSDILDEIRDNVAGESTSRLHLLTKKDLYNIQAAHNLQTASVKHEDDAVNVDAWVNEILLRSNSCVTFYKAQGLDYPGLNFNDYVLCIMNEGQCEILKKFGNDFICIDTIRTKHNNFQLHTILTLDNLKQGFPCAFIITNRCDQFVLTLCLKGIKDQLGITIQPKVFMSDVNEVYYNAWLEVMEETENRLYCTWHVDSDWRNNLKMIHSKQKQAQIYKTLRKFLQETDVHTLNSMIEEFIDQSSKDLVTAEFSLYFKNNFSHNTASWASCFRLQNDLNHNMHIERMHMTIKYMYLGGKNVKRLDRAITSLMKFVKNKLFGKEVFINKRKLSRKLLDIRNRHKASLDLDTDAVTQVDDGWHIKLSTDQQVYGLFKNDVICDCPVRCYDCENCIHQYSCSCVNSSIKWNMCKHVHLLCRFLKLEVENCQGDSRIEFDHNGETHLYLDGHVSEQQILYKVSSIEPLLEAEKTDVVPEPDNMDLIIQDREIIREYLNHILDNIQTRQEVDIIKKMVGSIESQLLSQNIPMVS